MIADSLTYPIRRNGWLMILLGAIFSLVLDFLQMAPVYGILAAVFAAGYFGAFYLDIINSTLADLDDLPHWPSFSCFWDDILSPFLRLLGLVIISFAPAILLFFYTEESWPLIAALVAGCFYFPMAVLACQSFGNLWAALPHRVLPALFRALPGYVGAVVVLMFVVAICGVAAELSAHVPLAGGFIAAAVALYSLMFQARLIGLIYRDKKFRIGWE